MIISHRHKYLFVELPHTACTAISKELCELYDGEPILRKHAHYHEFLRVATPVERDYFVFSGIRNPMDEVVSLYEKYRTNHRGNYTDPKKRKGRGGHVTRLDMASFSFIQETGADFPAFFRRFYRLPYDNWSSLAHNRFDAIIRYEHLQSDFAHTLDSLGLEKQRPLPVVNPTADKRPFLSYYTPEIWDHATWVFGPFMQKWGYDFPPEWGSGSIPLSSQALFHALVAYRNLRRRYLKPRSTFFVRSLDRLLENLRLRRYRHS
ncbi:MAG: sulfotransferase family 2 domain-containing protein [Anaerolineae bacterium]|nr:sulfotransferase family 2 domain-containing protein [Anaerolineae bacterium]